MLANQTSGYPDYETDDGWEAAFTTDPFHIWTYEERLTYAFRRPVQFPPGTNWSYSHTNFMVLGEVLARIGGAPLDELLREKVLDPMGLADTVATPTSEIPEPVLHAYSSERGPSLGIPAGTVFSEESTYFNSQWGVPMGANQTTTIDDLARTAVAVGSGALLSRASYEAMTGPNLLGFGRKEPACEPTCFTPGPDLQLRPRGRALRIVDPAEPAARRLQRHRGVPAVGEGGGGGRRDLPARRLRRAGGRAELVGRAVPGRRGEGGAAGPAASAAAVVSPGCEGTGAAGPCRAGPGARKTGRRDR
jgi:CubicO group peptidase (beta-lactamase class C family)